MPEWDTLIAEYPEVLGENFYFECDTGWYNILRCFLRVLAYEMEREPDKFGPDFAVAQVKEKFGTLRIYLADVHSPEVWSAIRYAELMSACTCEGCGNPGKLRPKGWAQTLCDACAKGGD